MRFGMGNQTSVLLEASCTGNLRKVQHALEKATSPSDVNRKGQVKLMCMPSGSADHLEFAAAFADLPVPSHSCETGSRTAIIE